MEEDKLQYKQQDTNQTEDVKQEDLEKNSQSKDETVYNLNPGSKKKKTYFVAILNV